MEMTLVWPRTSGEERQPRLSAERYEWPKKLLTTGYICPNIWLDELKCGCVHKRPISENAIEDNNNEYGVLEYLSFNKSYALAKMQKKDG